MGLSGCGTVPKEINIKTTNIETSIPIKSRPRPIHLQKMENARVVNSSNYESFIKDYKDKHGEKFQFIVFTPQGYKNLAFNLVELRRYLRQQKNLILYYEESIKGRIDNNDK